MKYQNCPGLVVMVLQIANEEDSAAKEICPESIVLCMRPPVLQTIKTIAVKTLLFWFSLPIDDSWTQIQTVLHWLRRIFVAGLFLKPETPSAWFVSITSDHMRLLCAWYGTNIIRKLLLNIISVYINTSSWSSLYHVLGLCHCSQGDKISKQNKTAFQVRKEGSK